MTYTSYAVRPNEAPRGWLVIHAVQTSSLICFGEINYELIREKHLGLSEAQHRTSWM